MFRFFLLYILLFSNYLYCEEPVNNCANMGSWYSLNFGCEIYTINSEGNGCETLAVGLATCASAIEVDVPIASEYGGLMAVGDAGVVQAIALASGGVAVKSPSSQNWGVYGGLGVTGVNGYRLINLDTPECSISERVSGNCIDKPELVPDTCDKELSDLLLICDSENVIGECTWLDGVQTNTLSCNVVLVDTCPTIVDDMIASCTAQSGTISGSCIYDSTNGVTNTLSCDGGKTPQEICDSITANGGASWDDVLEECTCNSPDFVVSNYCINTNQSDINSCNAITANGGATWDNALNECACNSPEFLVSNNCKDVNQNLIDSCNAITANGGATWNGSSCVCNDSNFLISNSCHSPDDLNTNDNNASNNYEPTVANDGSILDALNKISSKTSTTNNHLTDIKNNINSTNNKLDTLDTSINDGFGNLGDKIDNLVSVESNKTSILTDILNSLTSSDEESSSNFNAVSDLAKNSFDGFKVINPLGYDTTPTSLNIEPITFILHGQEFTLFDSSLLSSLPLDLIRSIFMFIAGFAGITQVFKGS